MRHIKHSLPKRKRRTISSFVFIIFEVLFEGKCWKKTNIPKITHPAAGNQSIVTQNSNKTGFAEHTMKEKQFSTSFTQFYKTLYTFLCKWIWVKYMYTHAHFKNRECAIVHTTPYQSILTSKLCKLHHIVLGEVSFLCQSLLTMLLANSSTLKMLHLDFRWLHHDLFCSEVDMNVSKEGSRDMNTYREESAFGKGTRTVDGKRVWRHLQQIMETYFSYQRIAKPHQRPLFMWNHGDHCASCGLILLLGSFWWFFL